MNKTPVAFFAYNRPEHTFRALAALSSCRNFEECEFYLYADGPKTDNDRTAVEETRKVLRLWAKEHNAQIIEQPENLGLARSIASGVTELCKQYGRVVVVEDDLVVSPDFLHFMIRSLDRYEHEDKVMQVGGYTLSSPLGIKTDAFFLPVTTTWGWGTWQRSWEFFEWTPANLEAAKFDDDWSRLFDLNGTCSFYAMLEDRMAGRNDSWGILWWYAVSRQKGLVVYPVHSLVWNGGFDGSGIHCGSGDFLLQGDSSDYLENRLPNIWSFPDEICYKAEHLLHLETFFRSRLMGNQSDFDRADIKLSLIALAKRILKRLRNAIF
ncbi:MAG: hemolysin activation protein [Zetaproteobacteria bacterium CG_4_9_14_3_um_filter_49_83]|nr:MAG: hemolysin activation protein [Zetaproteobacteria bacterium CG1_02_49_23]PIQ33863.1 MAG: hemolysin activation protein [Zetaproteobacteria bacterium CG17_big_fil_post_rev_8_21_14_2_50_50_13]PIV30659.1 MAG: hemolysin activation protein [Zetaproteobacteria bacterium CG02_land_8_20_14_3_00_50_9]PIY55772.1 MAG: hemolysin activation protein [Zetaproteobacteria bacterium CG_4_10_14_0_8_um_filter_49_80]PJA36152.1 MAG: hemolysin activation protein [Zetaproteobacteria bacterium CG_4_9_14_3_um_filt